MAEADELIPGFTAHVFEEQTPKAAPEGDIGDEEEFEEWINAIRQRNTE